MLVIRQRHMLLQMKGLGLIYTLTKRNDKHFNTCNNQSVPHDKKALTPDILKALQKKFEADPKNILAINACFKTDPLEICQPRKVICCNHVFTHKVDAEIKPFTNQKNSGRCWLYATLNLLRIPFAKQHQVEEFEFSQSYLFFWDKIERWNFFLHTIVRQLQRGEEITGRLMSFLLTDPIQDGGQWDMVVNIITRYGVVPKKSFPDTYCCENSSRLNGVLKTKAREYTRDFEELIKSGANEEKLQEKILNCMEELYRIISICLGIPPTTFTWEYYNKNKAYCSVGPITPLKFYEEYVKPYCDVENKVCLVNDPRPENPFGATYTVDCLGNMIGGRAPFYVNLKIDQLIKYASESIKSNEAVWFGCQVSKLFSSKLGIHDLNLHDYKLLFGVDVNKSLTKAERLRFGDSCMDHAMVFTAVSVDSNGEPTKWRVENSWGDELGDKGYIAMTTQWFQEFVFEVVVDKKYLPKDILELLETKPKVLPAWDPMGSLAS